MVIDLTYLVATLGLRHVGGNLKCHEYAALLAFALHTATGSMFLVTVAVYIKSQQSKTDNSLWIVRTVE